MHLCPVVMLENMSENTLEFISGLREHWFLSAHTLDNRVGGSTRLSWVCEPRGNGNTQIKLTALWWRYTELSVKQLGVGLDFLFVLCTLICCHTGMQGIPIYSDPFTFTHILLWNRLHLKLIGCNSGNHQKIAGLKMVSCFRKSIVWDIPYLSNDDKVRTCFYQIKPKHKDILITYWECSESLLSHVLLCICLQLTSIRPMCEEVSYQTKIENRYCHQLPFVCYWNRYRSFTPGSNDSAVDTGFNGLPSAMMETWHAGERTNLERQWCESASVFSAGT